jgi:CheY-like chemotaxis protein
MKAIDDTDTNHLAFQSDALEDSCDSPFQPKAAIASSQNRKIESTPGQESSPSTALVLVADDDPMIRLLAEQALDSKLFEVIQAENGVEALKLFNASTPDLVLCDVMMPIVDGFELCMSIRATKKGKHISIVMLTGLNDARSIENAFAAGATDYSEKPVNWELLPYKLSYILRASLAFSDLQVSEERYSLVARGANDGPWDWTV